MMKKRKRHITTVISLWLLLVVVIAYLISSALFYVIHSQRADREAQGELAEMIFETVEGLRPAVENEVFTQAILYADGVSARMQANPASAAQEAEASFRIWVDAYSVSEMDLVDRSGVITVSTDAANVGYDLRDQPELAQFLELLDAEDYTVSYVDGAALQNSSIVRYSAAKIPGMDALVMCGVTQQDQDAILEHVTLGETGFFLTASGDLVIRAASGNHYLGQTLPELGIEVDAQREYRAAVEKYRVNGTPSYVTLDNTLGFYYVSVYPVKEAMESISMFLVSTLLVMTAVFVVLYLVILRLMKTVVLNKLAAVNKSLAVITSGDLNEKVNVRDTVEFNSLSDDINATVDRLKEYIAEAAARIDRELAVAKEIQRSALPSMEALPPRSDFTLAASMDPAKEVGGDFYDFYFLGENKLSLLIADVAGKGIPGAMYMMRSKSLIKNRAQQGGTPAEIIADVNEALCEGNDTGMFVTVWFAILDLTTGRGVAVNAGHEHPALRRGDGSFELVKYRHSPAVATMEGIRFREHEFELRPGDCLFVYTDGVAEATDAKPELFGEGRLLEALNQNPAAPPKELISAVKQSIDAFVGEADQFDDITMLCLEYFGPQK